MPLKKMTILHVIVHSKKKEIRDRKQNFSTKLCNFKHGKNDTSTVHGI